MDLPERVIAEAELLFPHPLGDVPGGLIINDQPHARARGIECAHRVGTLEKSGREVGGLKSVSR